MFSLTELSQRSLSASGAPLVTMVAIPRPAFWKGARGNNPTRDGLKGGSAKAVAGAEHHMEGAASARFSRRLDENGREEGVCTAPAPEQASHLRYASEPLASLVHERAAKASRKALSAR
ncbi:unnamed protein product [Ixodes persulcatus]